MACFESARRHAVPVPLAMEQGGLVKELFYQGNWPLGLGEGRILLRSEQTHSIFQIEVIVSILLFFSRHGVVPEEKVETFEEKPIEENFYLCTEVFFGPYSSMINRLIRCRC